MYTVKELNMATIRKRNKSFQAIIRKSGFTLTKSFSTKTEAKQWAQKIESEINEGNQPATKISLTFGEAIDSYNNNHLIKKKSYKKEQSRIALLKNRFGSKNLQDINSRLLSQFREERLQIRSPYSVSNELSLILRVLRYATIDLGVQMEIPAVRRPSLPQGRARRPTNDELQMLRESLDPVMSSLLDLAIETAMRRSEISGINPDALTGNTITLSETKNGTKRIVPLSNLAIRCINQLKGNKIPRPETISKKFHEACKDNEIHDLRWHDLRHHATSLLFERGLNMMEVSAITGHKTLQMLKRYTHLRAEDLARKLG